MNKWKIQKNQIIISKFMMGKIIEDINYEEIEKMELPKNLVKFDQPKTPLIGVLTNKSTKEQSSALAHIFFLHAAGSNRPWLIIVHL